MPRNISEDDAFFNALNIPGVDDGEDDGTDDTTEDQSTASTDTTGSEQDATKTPSSDTGYDQLFDSRADGKGGKQPEAPGDKQSKRDDLISKDGNLYDKDGNLIAARGAERRHYENAVRFKAQSEALKSELDALKTQIGSNQALTNTLKTLNINDSEATTGLQLVANFKQDPAATARAVVAEALKTGASLSDILGKDALGNIGVGDVQMQAMRRMLDEALAPTRDRLQQEQAQERARVESINEYNRFISQYPLATLHEETIAGIMTKGNMDARDAYMKLYEFAINNGLDFGSPLGPQLQAKQAKTQPATQPVRRTPTTPVSPKSYGGGETEISDAYAPSSSSWEQILHSVMKRG